MSKQPKLTKREIALVNEVRAFLQNDTKPTEVADWFETDKIVALVAILAKAIKAGTL